MGAFKSLWYQVLSLHYRPPCSPEISALPRWAHATSETRIPVLLPPPPATQNKSSFLIEIIRFPVGESLGDFSLTKIIWPNEYAH
jgi:hypothetical protein